MCFIFTRKSMTCTKKHPYDGSKYNHKIKLKVYHKELEHYDSIPDWPNGVMHEYICKNCNTMVITEGEEILEVPKYQRG